MDFQNIPSGSTYVLEETKEATGYDKSTAPKFFIEIKLGVVTVKEYKENGKVGNAISLTDNKLVITNKIKQVVESIPVKKEWEGYSASHPNIDIILIAKAGEKVLYEKTITLKQSDNFSGLFKDVPTGIYSETGENIVRIVSERAIDGYTLEKDYPKYVDLGSGNFGYLFKNKQDNVSVSVPITKVWVDTGKETRPESVKVWLIADGVKTDEFVELTAGGNWSNSFENLHVYDEKNGYSKIKYTVQEEEILGYSLSLVIEKNNGFEITNTINQQTITVSGTKRWKAGEESVFPHIVINLYKNDDF